MHTRLTALIQLLGQRSKQFLFPGRLAIMTQESRNEVIPDVSLFPETGVPEHPKLSGYDLYKSMGSPKHIVAPMVDQSELALRILSRRYGADLVYTPMINAKIYVQQNRGAHRVREGYFNQEFGEEGAFSFTLGGKQDTDRPLIVQVRVFTYELTQFCANDPDMLLDAARHVQDKCDAVDLNLGCPQQIARRGNFGAFLQEDWNLIFRLINTLHLNLKVPVTAKFRVYESVEKSIAYARMIERAGAQMVTVHGRTREMKGHKTGLADWSKIRAVKQALSVPVFANGNMLFPQDWRDCLEYTGCDGVMSAEGNLYNPTLFCGSIGRNLSSLIDADADHSSFEALKIVNVAHEYLDIVANLKTPTSHSALKGHMFKITRPALAVHTDLRPVLGKARSYDEGVGEGRVKEYRAFVIELEKRLKEDVKNPEYYRGGQDNTRYYVEPSNLKSPADPLTRPNYIPHWYLQPYFRPPLNQPKTKENNAVTSNGEISDNEHGVRAENLRMNSSGNAEPASDTPRDTTAASSGPFHAEPPQVEPSLKRVKLAE